MEQCYIIKAIVENSNIPMYYSGYNAWKCEPKYAKRFYENSISANYIINYAPHGYNCELIDFRNEIGTYISTYKKKHIFKKYVNITLLTLMIPILLPIVGTIMLKDKILELCHISPNKR